MPGVAAVRTPAAMPFVTKVQSAALAAARDRDADGALGAVRGVGGG